MPVGRGWWLFSLFIRFVWVGFYFYVVSEDSMYQRDWHFLANIRFGCVTTGFFY